MKRGKRRYLFPAALLGVLAYQLFFPIPSGRELVAVPVWTVKTDGEVIPAERRPGAGLFSGFRLAGHMGYVDPDGTILFREKIAHNAAIHDEYFVNYSAMSRNLMIRDSRGQFLGNITGSGYPFVRGGRLHVISVDGHALSRYGLNGDQTWERKFDSLLTAIDAGRDATIAGLLNGNVYILNEEGAEIYRAAPEGSAYPVILQAGISADGRHFAVISGIEPQKLTVFERTQRNYRPVYSKELAGSYRRAVKARYYSQPGVFLFEQPGGAWMYHAPGKKLSTVSLPGSLADFAEECLEGMLFAVSRKDGILHGTGFLPSGRKVLQFGFPDQPSFFFRQKGNSVILGLGDRLYRIDMRIN